MDNTLILTVGLPRSGKSTWARQQPHPRVNPDSIRLAMHGHVFLPKAEPLVWAHARIMVESLFLAGHQTVILDATNVSRFRRLEWRSPLWTLDNVCFPTPIDVCIKRAHDTGLPDLEPVIRRMAKSLDWPEKGKDEHGVSTQGLGRLYYLEDVERDHIGEQGE